MCYVYNYVESWICHCKFGLLIFKMNFVMMLCRVIVEQTIIYFKSTITFSLLCYLMQAFVGCSSPLLQANGPFDMGD